MYNEAARQIEDGFAALRESRPQDALQIGEALVSERNTAGYELIADAYWQLGQPDKTLLTLENALQQFPTIWRWWLGLGIYYASLEQYPQSNHAFEQASVHAPDETRDLIWFNWANALQQQERFEDALEKLSFIRFASEQSPPETWVGALQTSLLLALERYQEAIALANQHLSPETEEAFPEWASSLYADRGIASFLFLRHEDAALRDAYRSIQLNPDSEPALWLLREIDDQVSPSARFFALSYQAGGQHYTIEIIADNEAEAKEFARRLLPEPMLLVQTHQGDLQPDLKKGVYSITAH